MTDRKTIQELIDQSYSARQSGDVEGLMAAFHPDAVFELVGSKETLAVTGSTQGHQNVKTAMSGFIAAFHFIEREIISSVIDGDRASVHSRIKVKYVPGDKTVVTDVVDLFKFKDGKVVELVEFGDTALIKSMMTVD